MTSTLSNKFGSAMADRIRSANTDLASRWLDQLRSLLPDDTEDIFPSDAILDHIPALIGEIASFVGAEAGEAVSANTAIQSKAHELGELRFEQKASVHQLLREYRLLGTVLADFVRLQTDELALNATVQDAVVVVTRLNEAVFVLLERTVETFVGRYTDKIAAQTARLEDFNRMLSHELRQPLSSLRHAVELLDDGSVVDPDDRQRVRVIARRSVQRLADMIRTMGTLARPEGDNAEQQVVDLSKIVAEAVRQVRDSAEAKHVEIRQAVDPIELTVDVARLELALINLVSNAIKYRDPSKTDPFVEIRARESQAAWCLDIRDNGLGILQEDQSKVFGRYFRSQAARDAQLGTDGSGLGLAIAAECIAALGGTITLVSQIGEGTIFTITLPVTSDEPAE